MIALILLAAYIGARLGEALGATLYPIRPLVSSYQPPTPEEQAATDAFIAEVWSKEAIRARQWALAFQEQADGGGGAV